MASGEATAGGTETGQEDIIHVKVRYTEGCRGKYGLHYCICPVKVESAQGVIKKGRKNFEKLLI